MPAAKSQASPNQPNIVIILADDLGACDLGAYGNHDAETPNLDRLAARSLRHEAFYVTPVCAPTRAELLTGRDHLRTGVAGVHGGKDHIHLDETLLPEMLRRAGYATGIWGKWHSGDADGYRPHQRGFDGTLQLRLYQHRDPVGSANGGPPIPFPGRWGDDIITDHALDFAYRHRERPFFALVASMTPHGPLDAPEPEIERFMCERGLTRNVATLHAQVARLDQGIGRLLDGLETLDPAGRDTLVLFLSDNGPAMFEDDFTDADRARRNGLGWRGWKGDVWEAGIRSPLFVHRIGQPESREIHQPAKVTDLLPTLLDYAGLARDPADLPLDGRSIRPMLEGRPMPEAPIHSWVHPAIPPAPGRGTSRDLDDEYRPLTPEAKAALDPQEQVMALRFGTWKRSRNADRNRPGGPHHANFLGDLTTDPRETTDLGTTRLDLAANLDRQMDHWFRGIQNEPHAFAPPELPIAPDGAIHIRASWAAFLGPGLHNRMFQIEGFHKPGQIARWNLQVARTRQVEPSLEWREPGHLPTGTHLALRCSGAHAEATTTEGGRLVWDAPLTLDAGPNTLELEILALPPVTESLTLATLNLLDPNPGPTG